MSSPKSAAAEDPPVEESPRVELHAFAGLHQAIARLCMRDGRSRKDIAEAAQLNASMLSGYCSGRRIPSLEHLDRLLTTLGVGIEELTYELRALDYGMTRSPLVLWPRFLKSQEGGEAAALLTGLLEDVRNLLMAQAAGSLGPVAPPTAPPARPSARPPARKTRGRKRSTETSSAAAQQPMGKEG